MKKIIISLTLLLALLPAALYAQSPVDKPAATDYEEFTSRTGTLIKILDIQMPSLTVPNAKNIHCAIRTVTYNNNRRFYYYLDARELDHGRAMIPYYDLYNLRKAIDVLMSDVDMDSRFEPAHLENRYTTNEHFTVGYYVEKGTTRWYIRMAHDSAPCYIKEPMELKTNINNTIEKMKRLITEIKD